MCECKMRPVAENSDELFNPLKQQIHLCSGTEAEFFHLPGIYSGLLSDEKEGAQVVVSRLTAKTWKNRKKFMQKVFFTSVLLFCSDVYFSNKVIRSERPEPQVTSLPFQNYCTLWHTVISHSCLVKYGVDEDSYLNEFGR